MSIINHGDSTYGFASGDDIPAAVSIYLQNFPHLAEKWFVNPEHARVFYSDLIELLWRMYSETFFTAKFDSQLAGFLILTVPESRVIPTFLNRGFLTKVTRHFLSGSYGRSIKFYTKVLKDLARLENSKFEKSLRAYPKVYILAVDQRYTGMGIGSELIQRALDLCSQAYRKMWLYVEIDNTSAVRFYQRFGFRIIHSNNIQHVMTIDLITDYSKFDK